MPISFMLWMKVCAWPLVVASSPKVVSFRVMVLPSFA
ncbi:Uncharacterised protein [Mycobacterium tuberculosis]|nr:Uncharacterised protein [Mycobacterium tuberculosis]